MLLRFVRRVSSDRPTYLRASRRGGRGPLFFGRLRKEWVGWRALPVGVEVQQRFWPRTPERLADAANGVFPAHGRAACRARVWRLVLARAVHGPAHRVNARISKERSAASFETRRSSSVATRNGTL